MVKINSSEFGEITIEGKTYAFDMYVCYNGELREAKLLERHLFSKEELSFLLKKNPEIIIIGTGQYGLVEVSKDVKKITSKRGIELIKASTQEAIKKFNELVEKGRKVVGFFHITC
jgi:hypothetical protein